MNASGNTEHRNRTDRTGAGVHRFGLLEQLVYGRPFEQVIVEECERRAHQRVAIFTTRSIASSLAARLQPVLGARHAVTFSRLPAHTPVSAVLAAAAAARQSDVDLIVALGGGSVIDAAKAALLSLWSGATTPAQLAAAQAAPAGAWQVSTDSLRMIAVPTTLSGAEFTHMAGVSNEQGCKERFMHPLMVPRMVVLDPNAGLQTPSALWLSTGMRAMDHAIETVCSATCDVLSEAAALRGLVLLCKGLQRVAHSPDEVGARLQCQLGMWMACVGPSAGVPMGVSHGIGHILGAEYDLPHGITSCVMMAAAMTWNRSAVLARQQLLERQLELPGETAAEKIDYLLQRLGLPRRLSDVGIQEDAFTHIAKRSMTDFFIPTNPRPIRSADDIVDILRLAA